MQTDARTARFLPIAGGAMATTFALFYLMQNLVAMGPVDLMPEHPRWNPFDGVYEEPKIEPRLIDRLTRPEEVKVPEATTVTTDDFDPSDGGDIFVPSSPPAKIVPDTGPLNPGAFMSDGEAIPLARVQAVYPRRAADQGIEGWAVVEFTVAPDGSVLEPRIVEAEPQRIFDKATLDAIARFKFRPKVVDGQARATSGMRYRMVYNLEGNG